MFKLFQLEGADRELRKSEDATHFATDGPAPRHYDGHTAAARVRVAGFVRSEYSNALVGDGVPQPAPRSANLRLKPGEQLLCCSHTLCTADGTAYCAAATAVTAMGSPSLGCEHRCCVPLSQGPGASGVALTGSHLSQSRL